MLPDLAQPAVLERLLFWLRLLAATGLAAALIAGLASTFVSSRLDALRRAEIVNLQAKIAAAASGRPAVEAKREPAGRQISVAQHATIVGAIEGLAGTKVHIVSVPEFEPGSYAHQIIKTLRAAGLDVRVSYFPDVEAIQPGQRAYLLPSAERVAEQIVAAFEHAGVALPARRGAPGGGAVIEIHIGRVQSPAAAPDPSASPSEAVK